jgi:enoyl-[acyl-carrier protein] reductase I
MDFRGKHVVVLGVADASSIGWAIAKAFAARGAQVTIGHQERFAARVGLLLRDHAGVAAGRCDVLDSAAMIEFFRAHESIDVLVHAIGHAPPELFTRAPSEIRDDAFCEALRVSALSLSTVVRHARASLRRGASVITLTYQASQRAAAFYGAMSVAKAALECLVRELAVELGPSGIRVNAISPGYIKTIAALGINIALTDPGVEPKSFHDVSLDRLIAGARSSIATGTKDQWTAVQELAEAVAARAAEKSALRENVSADDVAGCALFLGSEHAQRITGQVIHVDAGYSIRDSF